MFSSCSFFSLLFSVPQCFSVMFLVYSGLLTGTLDSWGGQARAHVSAVGFCIFRKGHFSE